MWNDVKTGNTAATFDDGPVLEYGIKEGVPLKVVTKKPIDAQPVAVGYQKGKNLELQKKMNDGIKWLKDTGQIDQIINKYTKFVFHYTSPNLTSMSLFSSVHSSTISSIPF